MTATATLPTPTATPTVTADREHHAYKRFKLTPAQQNLVLSVQPLVWKFAFKLTPEHLRCFDWAIEETRDQILRNVCLAAFTFEPERGWKFTTYAFGKVKHQCWNYWSTKSNRNRLTYSLDEEDSKGETPASYLPSRDEDELTIERREVCEHIQDLLGMLHGTYLTVVQKHFGLDGNPPMSLVKIGKEIGLCTERVRQIRNAALKSLRVPASVRFGIS